MEKDKLEKVIEDINGIVERLNEEIMIVDNASARKRVRKNTLVLEKLGKLYRKYSV